jgi:hypothetical protein
MTPGFVVIVNVPLYAYVIPYLMLAPRYVTHLIFIKPYPSRYKEKLQTMTGDDIIDRIGNSFFRPYHHLCLRSMAENNIDWDGLRLLSLKPGGFRSERAVLWCEALTKTMLRN